MSEPTTPCSTVREDVIDWIDCTLRKRHILAGAYLRLITRKLNSREEQARS